jgi:hypothetical protein
MQRLFPVPRYCYREMTRYRLIPAGSDPSHTVSGESLLNILTKVSAYTGS